MKPEAIIFDMDGVLSDSEGVYDEALEVILARYGVQVPPGLPQTFRGISVRETWRRLGEKYLPDANVDELVDLEREYFDARLNRGEIPPVPFAFEMLRGFREGGMKIAVASSNFRYRVDTVLRQNGAQALVDAIATAEDVKRAKPAPDLFLLAARRLGVLPQNCLVIEDAPSGVEAARSAGMRVAIYAHPERARFGDCGADFILTSFEGVTLETLNVKLSKR